MLLSSMSCYIGYLYDTDESIIRLRLLVLRAGAIENKVPVGVGDLG